MSAAAKKEKVPATYTALAHHLYELVAAEAAKRSLSDVFKPWANLGRTAQVAWRDDATDAWRGDGSGHPLLWAREMIDTEVKRLKGLL
jgi:hypothetical protein